MENLLTYTVVSKSFWNKTENVFQNKTRDNQTYIAKIIFTDSAPVDQKNTTKSKFDRNFT